jgi:dTDP-4-dehydrorhamnose reductase
MIEGTSLVRRILVTGGGGLLGSKIVQLAGSNNQIVPTHFREPLFSNSIRIDITNKQEVFQTIQKIKPAIVIHTAGETNMDSAKKKESGLGMQTLKAPGI